MSDCLLYDYSQMSSSDVEEIFQVDIPETYSLASGISNAVVGTGGLCDEMDVVKSNVSTIFSAFNTASSPVVFFWKYAFTRPIWFLSLVVAYLFAYLFEFLVSLFDKVDWTQGYYRQIYLKYSYPTIFSSTSAVFTFTPTSGSVTEEPENLFVVTDDSSSGAVELTIRYNFPKISLRSVFDFEEDSETENVIDCLASVFKESDD